MGFTSKSLHFSKRGSDLNLWKITWCGDFEEIYHAIMKFKCCHIPSFIFSVFYGQQYPLWSWICLLWCAGKFIACAVIKLELLGVLIHLTIVKSFRSDAIKSAYIKHGFQSVMHFLFLINSILFFYSFRYILLILSMIHFSALGYIFCVIFWHDYSCVLTHCGLVTPYGIIDLGHFWFRRWLVTYSAPSHDPNQWWHVSWTQGNKIQWNLTKIWKISMITMSCTYLLMSWLLILPDHQHPCYQLCKLERSLYSIRYHSTI